ncbi:MAG TPA: hypothetical protein VH186_39095 [Chloroflexia bacterium]|nr:hypothetical protein [Chloroflexia bacterium]
MQLLREIEERYGTARSVLLPVVVLPHQLEMLRAAEKESDKGWNFLVLLFAGGRLLTQVESNQSHLYRLPEFRIPSDIMDLEDFEVAFKEKLEELYGTKVNLGRYLLYVHCTFMTSGPEDTAGEDNGTSSRTLHVFTARALNSDELDAHEENDFNIKLVKPNVLLDALQAEWSDIKTQMDSGGTLGDMKAEYDKSWAFVRARVVATAFQSLFGWPLPEV